MSRNRDRARSAARHARRVRARHAHRNLAAELGCSVSELGRVESSNFDHFDRLFGVEGTEVRINADAKVAARYQGTKATVIRLVRENAFHTGLQVEVQAYRRKAPLLVSLNDLEYPASGPVDQVFSDTINVA